MRIKTIIAALVLVTGCTNVERSEYEQDVNNRVDVATFAHQVSFEGAGDRLTANEFDRLNNFLVMINIGYGDRIELSGGTPGQRSAINDYLRPLMLPVRAYPNLGVSEVLTVSVVRHVVSAPSCGNWSKPSDMDLGNAPGPDFGCSTNSALAAMVANPADLLGGEDLQPFDAEYETYKLRKFRKGERPDTSLYSGAVGTEFEGQ